MSFHKDQIDSLCPVLPLLAYRMNKVVDMLSHYLSDFKSLRIQTVVGKICLWKIKVLH